MGPARLPPTIATLAIVAALALALGLGDRSGEDPRQAASEPQASRPLPPHDPARPRQIARRVAELRGLEFERVPRVRVVSAERWRERTREAAGRGGREGGAGGEGAAIEDFLKLSGLAAADFEAEQATAGVGELIGGFYRPQTNRLVLVEQPTIFGTPRRAGGSRREFTRDQEQVIAHEFVHALQAQNHPRSLKRSGLGEEEEIALSALVEGDATVVERRYGRRYLGLEAAAADRALLSPANLLVGLPPALVASVRFPYTAGADFVSAIEARGGLDLVDRAYRDPPATSEQILHPDKWVAGEEGGAIDGDLRPPPGRRWQTVGVVESGELDAVVILASGAPADVASRAAEGWDGGAFASYRLPGGGDSCEGACRSRRSAVLAYRWDSETDALEFAAAAQLYLRRRLATGPRAGPTFPVADAAASIGVAGRRTSIAYAPGSGLSRRLAEMALGRGPS